MTRVQNAPLRYADLVCLICCHDAEWTRRHSYHPDVGTSVDMDNSVHRVLKEIDAICGDYRNNINNFANKAYPGEHDQVPPHIYRPLHYVPIGHADALTVTLFDDLDPIHELTSKCSTTIEEVCVAFAPLVSSIGCSIWPEHWREVIVDIEDFVRIPLPPLLSFTRIKLGAIGLLGEGADFQFAVFKAIASNIFQALDLLENDCPLDSQIESPFGISKQSLHEARIAILDLQGQEEIGLLIASDNYSIGAAILARIQTATLAHLGQIDSRILDRLRNQSWFQKVHESLSKPQLKMTSASESINAENSHMLRWTRTTLAISHQSFVSLDSGRIKGYIDLIGEANIAVGHQQAVEAALNVVGSELLDCQLQPRVAYPAPPSKYEKQLMGHADLLIHNSSLATGGIDRLVPTVEAMRRTRLLVEVSQSMGEQPGNRAHHLVGLSSLATVPFPPVPELRYPLRTHLPILHSILTTVRDSEVAEGIDQPRARRSFCPNKLAAAQQRYNMPSSLARSILYLFQNYSTVLSNPFVFDAVIDLYDCFATFYAILTHHLLDVFCGKDGHSAHVPAEVVAQLSRFTGALHRAMEHRLYRAFPEDTHRETNVDFRGGLNQLVSGADALVKLLVGFIKRNATHNLKPSTSGNPYDEFGVVNRVDFEPAIVATTLWLGTEHRAKLAIIRSDVPHLCVLASYLDFVHEAGHLAFSERRHPRGSEIGSPLLPWVPINSVTEKILAEVYTNCLCMLLVAPHDPECVAKHMAVGFATSARYAGDLGERIALFTLFYFQVFLALEAAKTVVTTTPDGHCIFVDRNVALEQIESWQNPDCLKQLFARFKRFFEKYGPIAESYNELFPVLDNTTKKSLFDLFSHYWQRVDYSLSVLIDDVVGVYANFINDRGPNGHSDSNAPWTCSGSLGLIVANLEKWLDDPSNKGVPFQYAVRDKTVVPSSSNNMALVAGALGASLRLRMSALDLDKIFHVPLSDPSREVTFPPTPGAKSYSKYMLRSKDSFLFCCSPAKRRQRLQRQISLSKYLWHISNELKANRLTNLIDSMQSPPRDSAANDE